jgi:hypothetical protein
VSDEADRISEMMLSVVRMKREREQAVALLREMLDVCEAEMENDPDGWLELSDNARAFLKSLSLPPGSTGDAT